MSTNRAPVDGWTALHFGAGVVAGLAGVRFGPMMGVAVAYEVVEQGVERTEWGQRVFSTRGPESALNVLGDLVSMSVGWGIGVGLRG